MASTDNVAAYLTSMDDQVASCRAWGHEWPSRKLRPGRPLPKGYVPRLSEDSYIEVTETCLNGCGKKRFSVLFPGGVFDAGSVRRYRDPHHWPVIPREAGISRHDIQGEVIRRVQEEIVAAASRTAREEARGSNGHGAPAPVIFRGVNGDA